MTNLERSTRTVWIVVGVVAVVNVTAILLTARNLRQAAAALIVSVALAVMATVRVVEGQ